MAEAVLHAGCGGLVGRYMGDSLKHGPKASLFYPPMGPRPVAGTRIRLRCIRCRQGAVSVYLEPLERKG